MLPRAMFCQRSVNPSTLPPCFNASSSWSRTAERASKGLDFIEREERMQEHPRADVGGRVFNLRARLHDQRKRLRPNDRLQEVARGTRGHDLVVPEGG